MNRYLIFLVSFLTVTELSAKENGKYELDYAGRITGSPYDVVIPSLGDDPALADRMAGQLYYDLSSRAFKGINSDGGIDTLAVSGSNAVTSDGSALRFESARINCDASPAALQTSSSWINQVNARSGSMCSVVLATGIFSSEPNCVVTNRGVGSSVAFGIAPSGSTTYTLEIYGLNADWDAYLMCMGPR